MVSTNFLFLDFELNLLEFFDHLAQSFHLDIFGHIVLHPPVSMGPLSHAIGKEEGKIISGNIYKGHSVLELGFRLITEPTDEVC